MKNGSIFLPAMLAALFLTTTFSCKKEEARTCQEQILGEWLCSSLNGAPPGFEIALNFGSDGDGAITVTENDGTAHKYDMKNWEISVECDWLTFKYYINGFEHFSELKVNNINSDGFEVQGDLPGLFNNQTQYIFTRR